MKKILKLKNVEDYIIHNFTPNDKIVNIIENLKKILELVPEDCKDSAEISYSYDSYWGKEVHCYYYQEETDEEYNERILEEKEKSKKARKKIGR